MKQTKKALNYEKWENLQIEIIRRIEDNSYRRKYLEFLRDYQLIDRDKVDEIAQSYGFVYHEETNSYWRM